MFLKLYWLGAVLALMPLVIQPYEIPQEELFPYVPKDINGTTFPIDLEATTNSDMVLVKCPDDKYDHKPPNGSFKINIDIFKQNGAVQNDDHLFAWVPLLRQSTNQTNITCGDVFVQTSGVSFIKMQWTYNVIWKNETVDGNFMKRERATKDI
uniref:Defense protein 3 n=1 Tax=Strongyloides papillosus TaxID=174720 RepID=A0A0N5C5X9_STREA